MNKAVFLDRDGVINFERGDYSYSLDHFIINEGVFEGLKILQDKGYMLIIISNQGGIAKGRYNMEDVEIVHGYLTDELKKNNIELTDIYYCPHHSSLEKCLCRKPGSLMIEKAITRYKIDPSASYFIGDADRDIMAAERAGIKGIKINPNDSILNICKSL